MRPSHADGDVPAALAALRARGVRAVVEVIGAGPLSLLPLRDVTADWIHLDPGLTHAVLADPRSALVVEHTVALARGLGTIVVAHAADEAPTAWRTSRGCEVLAGESALLTAAQLEEWLGTEGDAVSPGLD